MNAYLFNKLLRQHKNSRKAVKRLYDYYYAYKVKFINYRFGGRLVGQDIAQQFFLKLFAIKIGDIQR